MKNIATSTATAQPSCSSSSYFSENNKPKDLTNSFKSVRTHVRSTILRKSPFLNTALCLFLLIMLLPCIFPKSLKYRRSRQDTLCNVGDEHECVCNKSRGDLDEKYMPCDYFLDVRKLTVLCIKMRHINLNARLYTNESYQQYFRRRIANIISKYCEAKPNGCYTIPSEEQLENSNSTILPRSSLLDDEKEPEFTPANVVLLRVVFLEKNRTEVYFVVTKGGLNAGSLNSHVLMDPEKVKYIMSSQIAPLSRVLGGIHIEELKLTEFRKRRPPADNTRLKNMMIVLGIGIGFCYFVVAVKQFRDWRQKRTANRQKDQPEKKSTRNYGTCTDHLLSNYEALNGKPKSKAIPSQKKKNITATFSNDIDGKRVVVSQSTPAFEPTKYQNMFACDPSQLPQEVFHMSEMVRPTESRPYQTKGKSSQSDLEDDDAFLPEAPLKTTNRQSVSETSNLPSVILVSSTSQENVPEKNNNKKLELYPSSDGTAAFLGIGVTANPYERPLSRRGSRESTPEQGEEEYEDNRDTPQPIGDGAGAEAMLQECLKKDLSMTLKFKAPSSNRQNSPTWTSDSEDEETGTVYHPLENDIHASDEEEIKHRALKTSNKEIPVRNRLLSTFHSEEISDSENEYGELNETKVLDRHHYERLQESPIPNSFTSEEIRQAALERESSLDMRHDE